MSEVKKDNLVKIMISASCPRDAYSVGKVYEVTRKEADRLKAKEVAKDYRPASEEAPKA